MSFQHRVFSATALLVVATAVGVRAQDPPTPRREFFRFPRIPHNRFEYRLPRFEYRVPRFEYRLPRLSMRFEPRIRYDRGDLGRRILERSLDRMNRSRGWRFGWQDRPWRRQFEAMSRVRVRMDRLPKLRPFFYRRHLRTI